MTAVAFAAWHFAAACLATRGEAWRPLAGAPNPAPQAPPGLTGPVTTIIAWGKWGVLVCGVASLLGCVNPNSRTRPNWAVMTAVSGGSAHPLPAARWSPRRRSC
jgi:hypothetical protein